MSVWSEGRARRRLGHDGADGQPQRRRPARGDGLDEHALGEHPHEAPALDDGQRTDRPAREEVRRRGDGGVGGDGEDEVALLAEDLADGHGRMG